MHTGLRHGLIRATLHHVQRVEGHATKAIMAAIKAGLSLDEVLSTAHETGFEYADLKALMERHGESL